MLKGNEVRTDETIVKKIDQLSPYLKYIGRAETTNTASGAAAIWQIMRITIIGGVMTQEYADFGSYRNIWDNRASLFGAFTATAPVQGTLTVGASAVELKVGGSALPDRKLITLYNASGAIIYWGWTSSVDTSTGFPIAPGATQLWADDGDVDTMVIDSIYLIAGSAGNTVRIAEKP